jgi:hypothetical protein
VSHKRKVFFSRFLLRVCKLFFGQTLNPRPRFSGKFSQKVTGGGYGQGFQVANERTRGGETLGRLAIALFTNDSLDKSLSLESPAKRTQVAQQNNGLANRVAALIECMSLRNPGLAAIAATRMGASQANTLLAFIDHTIRGHTQSECSECEDGGCCVL